jgi:gliding motility-associated-like protein
VFDVHAPLQPSFVRPPIRCPDEVAEFVAIGSFTTAATVSWEFGDDAAPVEATGTSASAVFSTLGARPVLLTVVEFGCTETYQDSVIVYPRIELEVVTDSAGCLDEAFAFTGNAAAWTGLHYLWDLGDGTLVESDAVDHRYSDPGVYDVAFTVSTDEGCIDSESIVLADRVEVYPRPVADFIVEPEEVSLMDPRVEVKDRSQLASEWSYTIEGTTFTEPSFSYEFWDAGQYDITQVVTSGYNCSDAITHTVFVTDHLFYAPNAFTPDGDGLNDTFAPLVRGAREYEIVIVDRWGVERFRSTDPKAEWTGDDLPQGIFTYTVRIAEHGAYSKDYSGHVTLLR